MKGERNQRRFPYSTLLSLRQRNFESMVEIANAPLIHMSELY